MQGLTIHLKGFAQRVEYNDSQTQAAAERMVKWIKELRPARVVWDGDNHSHDSFTALIPQIYNELLDYEMQLIAFLRECDRDRFEDSWWPIGLPLRVHLCPSTLDFQKLGTYALEMTDSKTVGCFGGGGVVEHEYKCRPKEDVQFSVFPITRPSKMGDSTERCALEHYKDSHVTVITDDAKFKSAL